MIAVMGATGNTGRKITEALLQAGEKVRALGGRRANLQNSGEPELKNLLATVTMR